MAVVVNKKVIKKADKSTVASICPMGVYTYDPKSDTLSWDNEKCISCGACASVTTPGAIEVVYSVEEAEERQQDLDK